MILDSGDRVSGYEVLDIIGTGAASEVYTVREVATGTLYALKLLTDPTLSGSSRFRTEAGILALFAHRNIVRSHGFFDVRGHPAMLLDLARGDDLFTWLSGPGLQASQDQRLRILAGILRGVAAAHAKGIVHRDLKPSNVLLVPFGDELRPKVADFGLAKLLSPEDLVQHATRTNTALGTLGYMAPEQNLDAKRVDHRADLWSLGCIAYEVFTGAQAFPGSEWVSVLNRSMRKEYAPLGPLAPGLPATAVRVVEACLEPDPGKRPRSCGEIAAGLGIGEVLPEPVEVEAAQRPAASAKPASPGLSTMPIDEDWFE